MAETPSLKSDRSDNWVYRTPGLFGASNSAGTAPFPEAFKKIFLKRLSKTKADRLNRPAQTGSHERANGPVIDVPNYLSGRTEHCRATFPCLANTRHFLHLISLVRGAFQRKGREGLTF
jgi:hypothetical protein